MSEQEEINLYRRIRESISNAQMRMLNKKMKLGETVVIADNNGMPIEISAKEAIDIFARNRNK